MERKIIFLVDVYAEEFVYDIHIIYKFRFARSIRIIRIKTAIVLLTIFVIDLLGRLIMCRVLSRARERRAMAKIVGKQHAGGGAHPSPHFLLGLR